MMGDPTKEAVRTWLGQVRDATNMSLSAIARRSGLATTTLTRFYNQPGKYQYLLSTTTLIKVASSTGIAVPLEILATAPLETDPEILQIALAEARASLAGVQSTKKYAEAEAETVAEFYDVLMDALRSGRSVEEAAKTLQSRSRRARRRNAGAQPRPRSGRAR